MKSISAIAAVDKNWGIGKNGKLPWNCPSELSLFHTITKGKVLIMGRKTYHSLPKPYLPDRKIIVISKHKKVKVNKLKSVWCESGIYTAIAKAILVAPNTEIVVAGGSKIYKEFLPIIDKIYLSIFNADYNCDTFFPTLDVNTWESVSQVDYEEFTHRLYRKKA